MIKAFLTHKISIWLSLQISFKDPTRRGNVCMMERDELATSGCEVLS